MSKEYFNSLVSDNLELLDIATNKNDSFYDDNIKHLISENSIYKYKKYFISKDIINIYIDIIYDITKYSNYISEIVYDSNFISNYYRLINDMIKLKEDILKYIDNIQQYWNSFDIKRYSERVLYNYNEKKYCRACLSLKEDLLKKLDNFKNTQLNLFNLHRFYLIHRPQKESDDNIIENFTKKFIENRQFIELTIIRIKYADGIGNGTPLSFSEKIISDYISEYNICNLFSKKK